jgi:hypothetical protein
MRNNAIKTTQQQKLHAAKCHPHVEDGFWNVNTAREREDHIYNTIIYQLDQI